MVVTKLLSPLEINLDKNNPRFASFNYNNEKDIIDHLEKNEKVLPLAKNIIDKGYITLGERIIVVKDEDHYTVLEGNRRIAALKLIFSNPDSFSEEYAKKAKSLNIKDFYVDCDVISEGERQLAEYKISAKHIEGIKQWTPQEKRTYYDSLFSKYKNSGDSKSKAVEKIFKITPESRTSIQNAIKKNKFVQQVYDVTKKNHKDLKNISLLDSDVLTSRVMPRLKDQLSLLENDDFCLESNKECGEIYKNILLKLGEAIWVNKTLNTRTLNTKKMWDSILEENKIIPGLNDLIKQYNDKKGKVLPSLKTSSQAIEKTKEKSVEDITFKLTNAESPSIKKKKDQEKAKYGIKTSKDEITVDNLNYDLKDNVFLYHNNNVISKKSSEYTKISFSSTDNYFFIDKSRIDSHTGNGNYEVSATYVDKTVKFKVILHIKKQSKENVNCNLTSEKWYTESLKLLNGTKKEGLNKIIVLLQALETRNNLQKDKDDFIIASFLIRTLIEYASKAYADENGIERDDCKQLPSLVSKIVQRLYQKKILNKEQMKVLKNSNDLETLNGQIHEYTTNISLETVKSIFKHYQQYLDNVFQALSE